MLGEEKRGGYIPLTGCKSEGFFFFLQLFILAMITIWGERKDVSYNKSSLRNENKNIDLKTFILFDLMCM